MGFRVVILLYFKQTRIYATFVRHRQSCDPPSSERCHSYFPAFEAFPGWIDFEVFVGLVQVQRHTIFATHQKGAVRAFASAHHTLMAEIHERSGKVTMQQAFFKAVLPNERIVTLMFRFLL